MSQSSPEVGDETAPPSVLQGKTTSVAVSIDEQARVHPQVTSRDRNPETAHDELTLAGPADTHMPTARVNPSTVVPEPDPMLHVPRRASDGLAEDDPETLGKYTLLKRVLLGRELSRKYVARRTLAAADDPSGRDELFIKWVPGSSLSSEAELGQGEVAQLVKDRRYLASRLRWASGRLMDIDSPNLPRQIEFVTDVEGAFMVEELIVGLPLSQYVEREPGGALPVAEAGRMGRQMLGPLSVLHALGLIHGDIKPSNYMVRLDGTVVLTDFDTLTEIGEQLTQVDASPRWAAQERVRNQPYSEKADIFSWGLVLADISGGVHPYDVQKTLSELEYVEALCRGRLEIADTGSLPQPIRPAVDAAILLDPTLRPCASELLALLDEDRTQRIHDDWTARIEPAAGSIRRWGVRDCVQQPHLIVRDVVNLYHRELRRLASEPLVHLSAYGLALMAAAVCAVVLLLIFDIRGGA